MRVTTQMVNASAAKAGMQIRTKSLLDYVGTDNTGNSLLNALGGAGSTDTSAKRKYEDIEDSSGSLLECVNMLLSDEEDNVFAKAAEAPDKLYDSIDELVANYNELLKKLRNMSTPLNSYYEDMLLEAVTDSETELCAIGITQDTNGSLSIDKDKLKDTDIYMIKNTLGSASIFTNKLAFIAGRIEDNAKANADSYTSQYNSWGDSYCAYSSKYDLWS